jgi:hypothetical protein
MRKAISVSALILALVFSAHAGEMQNDSPQPPPPQSASVTQGLTTEGIMQNGAAESLTQVALNLLAVLPSLP